MGELDSLINRSLEKVYIYASHVRKYRYISFLLVSCSLLFGGVISFTLITEDRVLKPLPGIIALLLAGILFHMKFVKNEVPSYYRRSKKVKKDKTPFKEVKASFKKRILEIIPKKIKKIWGLFHVWHVQFFIEELFLSIPYIIFSLSIVILLLKGLFSLLKISTQFSIENQAIAFFTLALSIFIPFVYRNEKREIERLAESTVNNLVKPLLEQISDTQQFAIYLKKRKVSDLNSLSVFLQQGRHFDPLPSEKRFTAKHPEIQPLKWISKFFQALLETENKIQLLEEKLKEFLEKEEEKEETRDKIRRVYREFIQEEKSSFEETISNVLKELEVRINYPIPVTLNTPLSYFYRTQRELIMALIALKIHQSYMNKNNIIIDIWLETVLIISQKVFRIIMEVDLNEKNAA